MPFSLRLPHRFGLLAAAAFFLVAASSAAGGITIKGVVLSDDFEEVTVTLSEAAPRALISYQLFLNDSGLAWSSGSVEVRNDDTKVLRGFSRTIRAPGATGKGMLEVRVCPQDPKTMDITNATCGAPFILPIDAGASGSFTDVHDEDVFADAIRYVHREGVVAGYPDGTFLPGNPINRAEFTKIMTLSLSSQEAINKCVDPVFSDIAASEWFLRYVCHAYANKLIAGYPDGTFKPAQSINFVEAAKILASSLGLMKPPDCVTVPCTDGHSGEHPWFEPYIRALSDRHSIPKSVTRFDQAISRGEMAEMIYRLRANVTTKESTSYETLLTLKNCDERLAAGLGSCE